MVSVPVIGPGGGCRADCPRRGAEYGLKVTEVAPVKGVHGSEVAVVFGGVAGVVA